MRRRAHRLRRRYGHSGASRKLSWAKTYSSSNFTRWRAARSTNLNEGYDIWSPEGAHKFGMEFCDSSGDLHSLGKFDTMAAAKEAAQRHDTARARFE